MIDILLATFNSGSYLREQIDSILAQTRNDWRLLIRDGGSTDGSVEVVREYAEKYPGRIILTGIEPGASAIRNFSELMKLAEAEFAMFCDHDDVWLPDKLAVTAECAAQAQEQFGADVPLLVFTDSTVADQSLRTVHPSMLRYQNLNPEKGLSLPRLLIQNVPSGHTMLMNRALYELARPVPPEAVMHDHWVALVAAAFGRIAYLDRSTVLYRQHSGNVFGAFHYTPGGFYRKSRLGRDFLRERVFRECRQAGAFLELFRDRLAPEQQAVLADFAALPEKGFAARRAVLFRCGIWKTGLLRNLGTLLFL